MNHIAVLKEDFTSFRQHIFLEKGSHVLIIDLKNVDSLEKLWPGFKKLAVLRCVQAALKGFVLVIIGFKTAYLPRDILEVQERAGEFGNEEELTRFIESLPAEGYCA